VTGHAGTTILMMEINMDAEISDAGSIELS
jgi:hypothetical protein